MEVIKLGIHLIIEFCLLEKKLVGKLAAILGVAWLLGFIGGSSEDFCDSVGAAFCVSLLIAGVAFFVFPKIVKSSFSEIKYFMDWLFHIASTIGVLLFSFFTLLPIFACFA